MCSLSVSSRWSASPQTPWGGAWTHRPTLAGPSWGRARALAPQTLCGPFCKAAFPMSPTWCPDPLGGEGSPPSSPGRHTSVEWRSARAERPTTCPRSEQPPGCKHSFSPSPPWIKRYKSGRRVNLYLPHVCLLVETRWGAESPCRTPQGTGPLLSLRQSFIVGLHAKWPASCPLTSVWSLGMQIQGPGTAAATPGPATWCLL